jgi:hypothetical protein
VRKVEGLTVVFQAVLMISCAVFPRKNAGFAQHQADFGCPTAFPRVAEVKSTDMCGLPAISASTATGRHTARGISSNESKPRYYQ